MKRVTVRSLLAIMLCLLFIPLVAGCSLKEKIIGKWVEYNGIEDGVIIEFNSNGTGLAYEKGHGEAFHWKVSEDQLILTLDRDGSTRLYHVEFSEEDAMCRIAMILDSYEEYLYLQKR